MGFESVVSGRFKTKPQFPGQSNREVENPLANTIFTKRDEKTRKHKINVKKTKIDENWRKTAKNRRINARKRKWMKIGEKPRKTAESMQNGQKLKKKHEKTLGSEVNGGGSEVGSEVNGG